MGENELYKIDKLVPYKTKTRERPYVNDGNLQIHLPNTKEAAKLENADTFNKLLSYYHEVGKVQASRDSGIMSEKEKVNKAMAEAENTFNSMMEISKELRQACQDLMQMQS